VNLYQIKITSLALFFILAGCFTAVLNLRPLPSPGATISITMKSEKSDTLEVYWMNSKQAPFRREQSSHVGTTAGEHRYELPIPSLHHIYKLRIDPGNRPGNRIIKRIHLNQSGFDVLVFNTAEKYNKIVPMKNVPHHENTAKGIIFRASGDPYFGLVIDYYGKKNILIDRCIRGVLYALVISLGFFYSGLYRLEKRIKGRTKYSFYWTGEVLWLLGAFAFGALLCVAIPADLPPSRKTEYIVCLSTIIGIFIYLALLASTPIDYHRQKDTTPSAWLWLWFAVPCFLVWSVYLLSFWPAIMSPDTFNQWEEVVGIQDRFRDWHPAFHTISMWLITRFWQSPAAPIFVQILAMGTVVGWAMKKFSRYGVPHWALWTTCILFAMIPTNGFMIVSLWKDVAYSISIAVFSTLIFNLVVTNGDWIKGKHAVIYFGISIFAVSTYRHNGILPAFMTPLILLFFFKGARRKIMYSTIVAVLLFVTLKIPVYSVMNVERGNIVDILFFKLTNRVLSKDNEGINEYIADLKKREYVREQKKRSVAVSKSMSNTSLPIKRIAKFMKSSSIFWRIKPLKGYYAHVARVNIWPRKIDGQIKYISSNKAGVRMTPLLKTAQAYLHQIYLGSVKGWKDIIWRPAAFLYTLIFALLIAMRRTGCFRLLLILAPVLLNSVPSMFFVSQKSVFRYHYPVVVVSLLYIIPLLFVKQDHGASASRP
jgi:hypothetical protein